MVFSHWHINRWLIKWRVCGEVHCGGSCSYKGLEEVLLGEFLPKHVAVRIGPASLQNGDSRNTWRMEWKKVGNHIHQGSQESFFLQSTRRGAVSGDGFASESHWEMAFCNHKLHCRTAILLEPQRCIGELTEAWWPNSRPAALEDITRQCKQVNREPWVMQGMRSGSLCYILEAGKERNGNRGRKRKKV